MKYPKLDLNWDGLDQKFLSLKKLRSEGQFILKGVFCFLCVHFTVSTGAFLHI